jgi:flagellar protein FlaG
MGTSCISSGAAELKQAVKELQQKTRVTSPDLQFSIDEDTGRTVIKITDATTKEVIRQIPPAEVIRLNKELDRMQGLLLHKQV